MLKQIAIGCALTFATTILHASGMGIALRTLRRVHVVGRRETASFTKAAHVASVVLVMFLASVVEAAVWAATYLRLGAFTTLEPALYFSVVTFTTLGYGDLVLSDQWRLVASFEAANGTIMFGWTTALIVAVVQRVYVGNNIGESARGRSSAPLV